MHNKLNNDKHEIASRLSAIPRIMRNLTKSFSPSVDKKLKKNEIRMLVELAMNPNMPMKHYIEVVEMKSGSFTYLIDKLEKKEIVKRVPDEKDKRVTTIQITENGKKIVESVMTQFEEHVVSQIKEWDQVNILDFIEALKLIEKVANRLDAKNEH